MRMPQVVELDVAFPTVLDEVEEQLVDLYVEGYLLSLVNHEKEEELWIHKGGSSENSV